jgi:hypothetical protein
MITNQKASKAVTAAEAVLLDLKDPLDRRDPQDLLVLQDLKDYLEP